MEERQGRGRYVRRDWYDWYADAKAYYESHGDLLVPSRYTTPQGYRLGQWINFMRMKYKGAKGTSPLYRNEIDLLESIGMVWSLHDCPRWEGWLALARAYYLEHGDLLVPEGCCPDGHHLDQWVVGLRVRYRNGLLSEKQIRDVERLGMVWETGRTRAWEDYCTAAAAYRAAHGNLLVPKDYVTADGLALGRWINMQRSLRNHPGAYHGKRPLSETQLAELEALGMVWNSNDARWEEMYDRALAFYRAHGKLPGRGSKTPDGGEDLGVWAATQRGLLRSGRMDTGRAERLRALGLSEEALRARDGSEAQRRTALIGHRFGHLTVLSRAASIHKKVTWLCRCDCGMELPVKEGQLLSGRVTSCGCMPSA